ncbi:MAG: AmmeMemoRadiSam system protein B [Bryobacterales bacterium]|nr:AmmeMemoRadiSam system protein B [Bryobacterales bacterium]
MATVHASPFSGSWYTSDPVELKNLLDHLLASSTQRGGTHVLPGALGFVVPHAGLVYSGTVAAGAYRHLCTQRPERAVILGFAHRGSPAGVWLPNVDAFRTPLGEIEVDQDAVEELQAGDGFRCRAEQALCDHSVEIQLPFLQQVSPRTRVVPVYVGHLDAEARRSAAAVLRRVAGPGTVLIASSDFTHYGRSFHYQPFPPDSRVSERLWDLDHQAIESAASVDSEAFLSFLHSTGSTVCGSAPIALLLETLAGWESEVFAETLDYQTSGEITGDYRHSVSYASLGFFPAASFLLDEQERRLLMESARRTLDHMLETGRREPVFPARETPALSRRAGVFVSLHLDGKLRGCVGTRSPTEPLHVCVPQMTLAAALDDTRFDALQPGEGNIEIEISVLTPVKRIARPEQFRLHEHGAYLEAGHRRSLLLPQVAAGRDWTAPRFLEALVRKAGLAGKVYEDPQTRLYVFRAQVFSEHLVS